MAYSDESYCQDCVHCVLQALAGLRIENNVKLSQALLEERSQKDIAVQQALAQARAAMPTSALTADKHDVTLVTDGKTTYHVQWVSPDMIEDDEIGQVVDD